MSSKRSENNESQDKEHQSKSDEDEPAVEQYFMFVVVPEVMFGESCSGTKDPARHHER